MSRKAQIQVARDDQGVNRRTKIIPRIDVDVIDILTTDFLPDLYQIFSPNLPTKCNPYLFKGLLSREDPELDNIGAFSSG